MAVTYWMLDNPESGTLVRRVQDSRGVVYEILRPSGVWEDHSQSLVWITMNPPSGDAYPISELEAARIRKGITA